MSVYLVAQLTFKDRARYIRYQQRFMDILQRFRGGRLLVADEHPQQLEGQWRGEKLVIITFPDEPSLRVWLESREYQEILVDRKEGADAVVLLARGVPAAPLPTGI